MGNQLLNTPGKDTTTTYLNSSLRRASSKRQRSTRRQQQKALKTTVDFKGAAKELDDFRCFDLAEDEVIRQDHYFKNTERIEKFTYLKFECTQDLLPMF